MNESALDKLFSIEFLGKWIITLLIIAFIAYASYKIFNIIFRSEIYFKKSAISYFLIGIFIFGFAIYFYNWLLKFLDFENALILSKGMWSAISLSP